MNCSGNKISNYHGSKLLEMKYDRLKINTTNRNDVIKIIGPPASISDFNKNRWFYIERLKTNQSLIKLGKQKIKKNNILIVDFDKKGILRNKELLNLDNMNDVNYFKTVTKKDTTRVTKGAPKSVTEHFTERVTNSATQNNNQEC